MADTTPPGFLRLPYEIREMIYKLLLVSDEWIIAERKPVVPTDAPKYRELWCYKLPTVWNNDPETGWSAQFLRVCKYFHAEASEFLYGHNKFQLSLRTLASKFLPTIGTRNASFIRHMDIARTEFDKPNTTSTISIALQGLPNLRCLYFTPTATPCTEACHYFCKHTPSQLKILVLRLALSVTTDHPHLKWFLEFSEDPPSFPHKKWYKFSDDESNQHPPRPHEHPETSRRYWHRRPRLEHEGVGHVLDIEEQLTRVKVVRVKTGKRVQKEPVPRPAWRI